MAKSEKAKPFNARRYMELAIEEMNKSIAEKRSDGKASPKVGAVLISPEGEILGTAHRGEQREGDHAEYTLLDRKFRDKNVTGNYLFVTLEPCAPGSRRHPKLGCAERIVNARIAKVWIGIEDDDPNIDRKGIKYLMDAGIEVAMFDADFQGIIFEVNKEFIEQAKQRAEEVKNPKEEVILTPLENIVLDADFTEFSEEALKLYINRAGLKFSFDSPELKAHLRQKQLVEPDVNKVLRPTGLGILLFGKEPRNRYPQAVVKVQAKYGLGDPELHDFDSALVLLPEHIENWLKKILGSATSRESFASNIVYDYPLSVLREAIINAIVHRDFDIEGAKIYLNVDDEKIVVKSPGMPVKPIKLEDLKLFKAPSLSRNPKIMAVFNAINYVEERGLGMEEMGSLPENYKLPRPTVTWDEPYLSISFPRSRAFMGSLVEKNVLDQLNQEERDGLFYIRDRRIVSKADYTHHFHFNEKKAQRHLSKFVDMGLAKATGNGPSRRYHFIEQA